MDKICLLNAARRHLFWELVKAVGSSLIVIVGMINIYHLKLATATETRLFLSWRRCVYMATQTFCSNILHCMLMYLMESQQMDVRWADCNNELPNL